METSFVSSEEALSTCAWCGKHLPDNTPVFGFGGKKRPGVDLSQYEGHAIRITLATQPRSVTAMVTTADSNAKRDGKDFMFLVCSEECASEMKSVMEQEVSVADAWFEDLSRMGH